MVKTKSSDFQDVKETKLALLFYVVQVNIYSNKLKDLYMMLSVFLSKQSKIKRLSMEEAILKFIWQSLAKL